jgi:hypothetical protein
MTKSELPFDQLPPWKRKKPGVTRSKKKLTTAQIDAAKARATQAGRRYPNLIDNMWAAKQALPAAADDGLIPFAPDDAL